MNTNDKFNKFLYDQPFDDIDLGIDSQYVDIGIGFNKKSGTKFSATIDLNSLGKISEEDIKMEAIKLEREKLQLKREMLEREARGEVFYKPTTREIPKTDKEENKLSSEDITEDQQPYSEELPLFGGKAFINED